MGKKKKANHTPQKIQPAAKRKSVGMATWIAGGVALIAVVAVIVVASGGSGGPASAAAGSAGSAPAAEAKYIGRLLPAAYAEPSVAAGAAYSSAVTMTDIAATQSATEFSVAVADVVAKKVVYFEYQKPGADPVSMIAYVKPSGKLFVGVGYCIPCKGKRQSIDADGTLRCEACGTKRDLESGVGLSGACKLYPLDEVPATVAGGKIVIDKTVVDGWTAQPLDRPVGA